MEAPKTVLEMFSPLLILEYIRLMSVAAYIKHEGALDGVRFKISADDYEKLMQEPLKTALIGIDISYADGKLTAIPSAKCLALYEHKVMRESVLQYWDNYGKRYENYISVIDENL